MLIKKDRENFWMLNWLDDYMIGHKGFIVGGCFKNIINGEKVKDLDIFFETKKDWESAVEYYDEKCGEDNIGGTYRFYYENDNVKAYKNVDTGITIELCCKIFGTPEEIINSFDFTIVKFAYYKEKVEDELDFHIEYKILHHDQFFEHLHMKRLVIDDKIPFSMSTFERMFRYAKYGYFPCRETKMKIIKTLHDVPSEQIKLSSSMYDGMD